MKKPISILLALVMLLALTACGGILIECFLSRNKRSPQCGVA